MRRRKKILEQELKRILAMLVKDYAPLKVILFGSLASGKVHEWSDIDLVIIKATNRRFLDRIEDVLLLIRPKVACDVIVYTPEEFREMETSNNYFIDDEIKRDGKVIYERNK